MCNMHDDMALFAILFLGVLLSFCRVSQRALPKITLSAWQAALRQHPLSYTHNMTHIDKYVHHIV